MSRPSPTLFSVLLRNTAAAFGVFLLAFLLVFTLGFWLTRTQRQLEASHQIGEALGARLGRLVDAGGQLRGEVVHRALMNLLDRSVFLFVFQADGKLIFWAWHGLRWYEEDPADDLVPGLAYDDDVLSRLPPEDRPVPPQTLYAKLRWDGKLTPLFYRGKEVGAFWEGGHPPEQVEESLQFLESLLLALVGGLVLAGPVTAVFAWRAFRRSTVQAGRVAAGLMKIADGHRDVVIPTPASRELETIAASALKLQEVLVRDQALRRRWAEDITHDLKSPLSGLRLQLDGMVDGVLEVDQTRLKSLQGEVGRLETLASDLLVLSRLEAPELWIVRQRLQLAPIAATLRELFVPQAREKGRNWVWTVADGEFFADPELLQRALVNLLSNAVNHATGKGDLEAAWSADSRGLRVHILNPGRLEAADSAPRVSEHGYGLTIAQTIAALHGGTLTLENRGPTQVEAAFLLPPG